MVSRSLFHVSKFFRRSEFGRTTGVLKLASDCTKRTLVIHVIFQLPPLHPRHFASIGTIDRVQGASQIVYRGHMIVCVREPTVWTGKLSLATAVSQVFRNVATGDMSAALVRTLYGEKLTRPSSTPTECRLAVLKVVVEPFEWTNPLTAVLRHRTVDTQHVDLGSHCSSFVVLDDIKADGGTFRTWLLDALNTTDAFLTEEVLAATGVDSVPHQLRAEGTARVLAHWTVEREFEKCDLLTVERIGIERGRLALAQHFSFCSTVLALSSAYEHKLLRHHIESSTYMYNTVHQ